MSGCLKALDWVPGCGLPPWAQIAIAAPFVVAMVICWPGR